MTLSGKQRAFIDAYLGEAKFNATEAARLAGYKGNDVTLASVGYENIRKPQIKSAIAAYWERNAMSAEEALSRIADVARADIGEFVTIIKKGEKQVALVDMEQVKKHGHLVKSISYTKYGPRIELHDAPAALRDIGKYHALFTDVTVKVEKELEDALTRLENNLSPEDFIKVIEALKQ